MFDTAVAYQSIRTPKPSFSVNVGGREQLWLRENVTVSWIKSSRSATMNLGKLLQNASIVLTGPRA